MAALAYPSGAVIASPYAASDDVSASFSALMKQQTDEDEEGGDEDNDDEGGLGDDGQDENNINGLPYADKLVILNGILNGTSLTDCFEYDADLFPGEPEVACYGPQVNLTGEHPDGDFMGDAASQQLPGGDLGIWEENEDGEACIAAKVNSEMTGVEARMDFAMFAMASAFCVANNTGQTLPEAGEELDLTEDFNGAIEDNDIDFTSFNASSIVLSRGSDSADGHPVYALQLSGTIDNADETVTPFAVSMMHVPLDDENTTYQGRVQATINPTDIANFNCNSSGFDNHTVGVSAVYERTSETDLRIRFRQALFCGEATDDDIFNDDGEVDSTNKQQGCPSGGGTPHGWGDDYNTMIVNADPTTGYANMVYAWQAGRCDGNTRVFKSSVTADGGSDGEEGGCGYFGFGPDASEEAIDIEGMICNWTAPGAQDFGSKTYQSLVQRQCVTRSSADEAYTSVSEELNISYAPTLSCDSDGALLCDGVACVSSNDLLAESLMEFTDPVAPSALDI